MNKNSRVVRKTVRQRRVSEERRKRRTTSKATPKKKKSYSKKNIRKPRTRQSIIDVYVPVKYSSTSEFVTADDLSSSGYVTAKEFRQKQIII